VDRAGIERALAAARDALAVASGGSAGR
jgi:hypothetical protein